MITRLCLMACALAVLASAGARADTAHYRHIMFRESPYAPYRGIHPVDPATARDVAHYAFERDAAGRLVRVSHRIGDTVIGDNGNWDSFIWFAPDVRIRYEAGREIHTYYDTSGAQIAAHGNVWTAVYTLDADGARTGLAFFDAAGTASENAWGIHRYAWRRTGTGTVFETRYGLDGEQRPLRPDFEFYEVALEYDDDGRLAFVRNYGRSGQPENNDSGAGIDRITYDLAGNFIRWQVYGIDGNPVEDNGPAVHLGEHLYDADGNKIGLRGFDRHGNRIPFAWGAILHRTDYDARGNRTGFRSVGEDGRDTVRLAWTWSDDGTRLTEVRALDAEGAPVSHPALGGAAVVRYRYSPDGGRTAERFTPDLTPYDTP